MALLPAAWSSKAVAPYLELEGRCSRPGAVACSDIKKNRTGLAQIVDRVPSSDTDLQSKCWGKSRDLGGVRASKHTRKKRSFEMPHEPAMEPAASFGPHSPTQHLKNHAMPPPAVVNRGRFLKSLSPPPAATAGASGKPSILLLGKSLRDGVS